MAEFSKIMAEARRLCGTMEQCVDCPLWDNGDNGCRLVIDTSRTQEAVKDATTEKIVLAWAKQHPELEYLSFDSAWKTLFPEAHVSPCPARHYGVSCALDINAAEDCETCRQLPIPRRIVERLKISISAQGKPGPEHYGCKGCKYETCAWDEEACKWCKHGAGITGQDLWEAAK